MKNKKENKKENKYSKEDVLKNMKIIIDPAKNKDKESKYYDTKLVDAGSGCPLLA